MSTIEIPDVVIQRLPLYVRVLAGVLSQGTKVISSKDLGDILQITPAQIRKDLSYFGRFGKQGRGYNVRFLRDELRQILGLDQMWPTCLVGVGRLGEAIINYPGFIPEGFNVLAAFDSDDKSVGRMVGDLRVDSISNLDEIIQSKCIQIGIVAVPASDAQSVIDKLVSSGVTGILNYAPISAQVPNDAFVRNLDPVLSLQSMTFYLTRGNETSIDAI
jgi:redox-sensing transcriptional repressor